MVLLCIEYIPSGNIITEKSLFSTGDNRYIFNLSCFDVLIAMFTGSRPAVSYSPGSVEDLTRQQVSCVPVSSFCFWEIVEQRYFRKMEQNRQLKKCCKNTHSKGKGSRPSQPIGFWCHCLFSAGQLASSGRIFCANKNQMELEMAVWSQHHFFQLPCCNKVFPASMLQGGCKSVAALGTAMLWLAGSMRRRTFQGKDVGGYCDSTLVKGSVETTQSLLGIFIKGIFLKDILIYTCN